MNQCAVICLSFFIGVCAFVSHGYAQAPSRDPVVARADGIVAPIEIRASVLHRHLKAHPNEQPEQAVQNLVDFALLSHLPNSKTCTRHPHFRMKKPKRWR